MFKKVVFILIDDKVFSIVVLILFILSIVFFILQKINSNSKLAHIFKLGEFFLLLLVLYIL